MEQYHRINLGFIPKYALVCNGGILLKNGQEDEEWYKESLQLIVDCKNQLFMVEEILKQDSNVIAGITNVKGFFVTTKSRNPLFSVNRLKEQLDTTIIDVFYQKQKVYAIPKKLRKGNAVKRLKEQLGAEYVIAAGDSKIDISMFWEANIALAPKELKEIAQLPEHTIIMDGERIFSEFILEHIAGIWFHYN